MTNISLEENDSFTIKINDYGFQEVNLNSYVYQDSDEIIISPITGIVIFSIEGADLENSFIGDLKIKDSCGRKGVLGPHTSFNKFVRLYYKRSDYYATLRGDLWWTS